ncbi:MAG: alcohol dehydrogenase catalytic domain-containing protein [Nocardioides sp.]|uniref:zinc-dependent alcohol dehydrogenase n=1 Tax=Nocardioides sp. TaxID=35761 RepID=UPI0039E610B6
MTLPEMMRAAVYHGREDIRFEQVPAPRPGAGELLLEVGTAGVCGSDVGEWAHGPQQHWFDAPHPATGHQGPIIPGHEFSGTVVAVGDGVDQNWLGTRVASCGSVACGRCDACTRGQSNQCKWYAGVGLHRHGALAEYVVTPTENCLSIEGTGLSLDEAALCQPMSIAVHNVSRAGGVEGQTVVVLGVGGIGTFLVYALAESGAHVTAADIDPERLRLATELGAERTVLVSGSSEDPEVIRAALGQDDLRVVFEVSGSRGGVLNALTLAPRGCRVVLVGIQKAPVEVDLGTVTMEEKILIGTNALVREVDFPRAVELVARRAGRWALLAPRVVPLDSYVEEALRPMSMGCPKAVKTLVDPRGGAARPLRTGP